MEKYLPLIQGKGIAIVTNHTSVVDEQHLVDTLLLRGISKSHLLKVFVPEHGFHLFHGFDGHVQVFCAVGKHRPQHQTGRKKQQQKAHDQGNWAFHLTAPSEKSTAPWLLLFPPASVGRLIS